MRYAAASIVTVLVFAAPASGATFGVENGAAVYRAAAGEVNQPTIGGFNGTVAISQYSGAPVVAGPGCTQDQETANYVTCPAPTGTKLRLLLGDRNDNLSGPSGVYPPAGVSLFVDGGAGNDFISGSAGRDVLNGGGGADNIGGFGGNDTINGGAGKDRLAGQGRLFGGGGSDFIELFQEKIADLRSHVFGGAGNDHVLGGNKKRDVIDCGAGRKDQFTTTDKPGVDRHRRCEVHF